MRQQRVILRRKSPARLRPSNIETLAYRASPIPPIERSGAAQIATVWVGRKRSFGREQPTLSNRRIRLRSAECARGVTHRAAYVSSDSRRALCNRPGAAFLIRSPPR